VVSLSEDEVSSVHSETFGDNHEKRLMKGLAELGRLSRLLNEQHRLFDEDDFVDPAGLARGILPMAIRFQLGCSKRFAGYQRPSLQHVAAFG